MGSANPQIFRFVDASQSMAALQKRMDEVTVALDGRRRARPVLAIME
jgi:hypothetical protein